MGWRLAVEHGVGDDLRPVLGEEVDVVAPLPGRARPPRRLPRPVHQDVDVVPNVEVGERLLGGRHVQPQ